MERISVPFKLLYGCELSPKEGKPRLLCYLDSGVENEPVDIPLDMENGDREIKVTITGLVDTRRKLSVDTQLVFYVTCEKANDFGAPCRVDAGFATVPLYGMVKHGGTFTSDLSLQLATVGNFEKGKLRMTTVSSEIRMGRVQWDGRSAIGSSLGMISLRNQPMLNVEVEIAQNIDKVMKMGMAMPQTWKATANVRVPIYYGDVGMQRKIPLPAAAFFLYKELPSNRLFWENNLKTVLSREGLSVHNVDGMDLVDRARVMVEICVSYAQYLDYIGDSVDPNRRFIRGPGGTCSSCGRNYDPRLVKGCERFGDAGRDLCGDCEDLGVLISMVFASLRKADFSDHPQLQELQRIAHQYVDFVSLDAVTSAAVEYGQVKKKIGAHMNCNFLPAPFVKECLERASPDGKCTLPFRRFSKDAHELPVLVGEGTGMYECYGIRDPIPGERNAIYRGMSSLKFAKKPIVHEPGEPSSFFVGSLEGFTPYWFEQKLNVCGAWYGYTGPDGGFTRGVHFTELETKSDKPTLRMHPAFSDAEMAYMRHATRIRVPPHPLYLTKEGIASHPRTNAQLDKICTVARDQGRPILVRQPPAPIYVRDYQLTPEIVKGITADIIRLDFVTKVTYRLESFTDLVYGYMVGISGNVQ